MFDPVELRNFIVRELYEFTGLPIVPTNSADPRPVAPYHTYNLIAPYSPRGSPISWASQCDSTGNLTITREELPSVTLSLNTFSRSTSETECIQKCLRMREWFYHTGKSALKMKGVIITSIGAVQDRTVLQNETEYQYRMGFDVQLRVISETTEEIGTIEKIEIEKVVE